MTFDSVRCNKRTRMQTMNSSLSLGWLTLLLLNTPSCQGYRHDHHDHTVRLSSSTAEYMVSLHPVHRGAESNALRGNGDFVSSDGEQCLEETVEFTMNQPELQTALMEFAASMITLDLSSIDQTNRVVMGYPDNSINKLEPICEKFGGVMFITPTTTYSCTMPQAIIDRDPSMANESITVTVANVGGCEADTDSCAAAAAKRAGTDDTIMSMWSGMGINCTEIEDIARDTSMVGSPEGDASISTQYRSGGIVVFLSLVVVSLVVAGGIVVLKKGSDGSSRQLDDLEMSAMHVDDGNRII